MKWFLKTRTGFVNNLLFITILTCIIEICFLYIFINILFLNTNCSVQINYFRTYFFRYCNIIKILIGLCKLCAVTTIKHCRKIHEKIFFY
jgi:hypothetical protein